MAASRVNTVQVTTVPTTPYCLSVTEAKLTAVDAHTVFIKYFSVTMILSKGGK